MLAYLVLIIICRLLWVDIYNLKCSKERIYNLIVFLLIIFSAFRFRIGLDSMRYEDSYADIPTIFNLKFSDILSIPYEPLWIIFCSVLRGISTDFFLLQLTHALIINSVFCSFIYKNTTMPFVALLVYVVAMYFQFNFESIRESLSIAVFLLFWKKSDKRKFWLYIGCLICILIHYGAIILLLFPCVKNVKLKQTSLYMGIALVLALGVLMYGLLLQMNFSAVSPLIQYKFSIYIDRENSFTLYSIIGCFIIPFTAMLLGCTLMKKQYFYSKYSLLYFLLLLSSFFIPITLRFANYFLIFYVVFLANLLSIIIEKHVNTLSRSVFSGIVIMFFLFPHTSWYFIKVTNTSYRNYDRYFPYTNIISKEILNHREYIADVEFL